MLTTACAKQTRAPWPTTSWRLVARAANPREPDGHYALSQLLTRCLPVLWTHLVLTRAIPPHHAEDLLQEFVAHKFLERNLPARAARQRGTFCTLLLVALDRFLVSERRRKSARKRGEGRVINAPSNQLAALAVTHAHPAEAFDRAWGRQVVGMAARHMKAACHKAGRIDIWRVFDARLLRPFMLDVTPPNYRAMAKRFGLRSPMHAANIFVTGKRMFRRHLRAVLGKHAHSAENVDDEICDLIDIFARTRTGSTPALRI